MATSKGKEFIDKYKGTDCLKYSWEMMYQKRHITLDEFIECAGLTEEEKEEYQKQIDICPEPKSKTLEELTKENEQLWETVQFLLKKTGMIGDDEDATT